MTMRFLIALALVCLSASSTLASDGPLIINSVRSGAWSNARTWEGGAVPGAGSRVMIRAGHRVVYDASSDEAIRAINVAGVLSFAPDRDTRLAVGLLKIQ